MKRCNCMSGNYDLSLRAERPASGLGKGGLPGDDYYNFTLAIVALFL